ncbi:hypothetical protein [Alistipes provencensis]|uniref:hypothetical protein n=1 Tax=Alistipes provencensis TaxID=1816676 RepID=UPI0007ED6E82|nr:hypothetical protein [Alistipes provencensis]
MSFAGHVFDMIKRNEANRAQLRKHREQAATLRGMYVGDSHGHPTAEKAFPPEQVAATKREIREQARRERRKNIIVIAVLTAAGIGAVVGMVFLYLSL